MLKTSHCGAGGTGLAKRVEYHFDSALNLPIRIECHGTGGVVDESDWQRDGQLAAPRLVEKSAQQTCPDHMKLGCRDGPFQTKKEPVVELRRVIQAVLVPDEATGERAQLQEPLPIGVIARQA